MSHDRCSQLGFIIYFILHCCLLLELSLQCFYSRWTDLWYRMTYMWHHITHVANHMTWKITAYLCLTPVMPLTFFFFLQNQSFPIRNTLLLTIRDCCSNTCGHSIVLLSHARGLSGNLDLNPSHDSSWTLFCCYTYWGPVMGITALLFSVTDNRMNYFIYCDKVVTVTNTLLLCVIEATYWSCHPTWLTQTQELQMCVYSPLARGGAR